MLVKLNLVVLLLYSCPFEGSEKMITMWFMISYHGHCLVGGWLVLVWMNINKVWWGTFMWRSGWAVKLGGLSYTSFTFSIRPLPTAFKDLQVVLFPSFGSCIFYLRFSVGYRLIKRMLKLIWIGYKLTNKRSCQIYGDLLKWFAFVSSSNWQKRRKKKILFEEARK